MSKGRDYIIFLGKTSTTTVYRPDVEKNFETMIFCQDKHHFAFNVPYEVKMFI